MKDSYNVESFNLDHTKVKAPFVRLCYKIEGIHGDKIYKYDIRFTQPNKEFLDLKSMHSLEHLLAFYLRKYLPNLIDISPMGCLTGFYLTIMNDDSYEKLLSALEKTLQDILDAKEVIAANIFQCGGAANHDLAGAKNIAQKMLSMRNEWETIFE